MLTNRINVTYNIENIDADFDIFRVEKANKDYYKYNILDSQYMNLKRQQFSGPLVQLHWCCSVRVR